MIASGPLDFGEHVHVAGFDIFYQKGSHITPHNSETDKTTLVAPLYGRADILVLFGIATWLSQRAMREPGSSPAKCRAETTSTKISSSRHRKSMAMPS